MKNRHEEIPMDILTQEYQEATKITGDDEVYVAANLRCMKIFDHIGDVNAMFWDRNISAYEALTRMQVLLGLANQLKEDIEKKL